MLANHEHFNADPAAMNQIRFPLSFVKEIRNGSSGEIAYLAITEVYFHDSRPGPYP